MDRRLRSLAGQTAIYGLSTIIGRILNYLLVPLYVRVLSVDEYGVVTELYAYAVLINILLTYGMETGFFRFAEKTGDVDRVFSTGLSSLFVTSSVFLFLVLVFRHDIAFALGYADHVDFIVIFAIILATDAVTALPFARLRQLGKASKFALFKILQIAVNIGLNLVFLVLFPYLERSGFDVPSFVYNPNIRVGYIFISNLVASIFVFILFIPDFFKIRFSPDFQLWKQLIAFSLPLVITGLAGMVNDTIDRILLKYYIYVPIGVVDAREYIMSQIGIYGANAKIAVLMTLLVQTFRFAADPFFFKNANDKNSPELFAKVMNYFIIFGLFVFLAIMLYIDIIKHLIVKPYWVGLSVVPFLLGGRLIVGILYNLSFWYKTIDKTIFGAVIFVVGSVITVLINVIFIPEFGYMACAYANLISYAVMLAISYFWSLKYWTVKYPIKKILFYSLITMLLIFINSFFGFSGIKNFIFSSFLILIFVITVIFIERVPFKKLLK